MIMNLEEANRSLGTFSKSLVLLCVLGIQWGCSKEEQPTTGSAATETGRTKQESESKSQDDRATTQLAKATESVSDLLARESLSQEELAQLGSQFADNWEAMMDDLVAQYEAAPDEHKAAILDRYIDMEMESRKQWDRNYKSAQKAGSAPSDEEIGRRKYAMFAGKDASERKKRSESRSPDSAVKQARFYRAVQQRAQTRGINMRQRGG